MRRLIIADVHANLPAFEAVLEDAGAVEQILFLGDIIDYGPNPAACVDLLIKLDAEAIIGNHDLAILAQQQTPETQLASFSWNAWTFAQLSPHHLQYLNSLPVSMTVDIAGITAKAIHAITYEKYLSAAMHDSELNSYLAGYREKIIICGHTHKLIDRQLDNQRLISIYSVGQPKDGNNQAGYTIEEDGVFEHKRVGYELAPMLRDVKKIALPPDLEQRWLNFMQKGADAEWSNL